MQSLFQLQIKWDLNCSLARQLCREDCSFFSCSHPLLQIWGRWTFSCSFYDVSGKCLGGTVGKMLTITAPFLKASNWTVNCIFVCIQWELAEEIGSWAALQEKGIEGGKFYLLGKQLFVWTFWYLSWKRILNFLFTV